MKTSVPIIFLISADPALTKQLVGELVSNGCGELQVPLAVSIEQARKKFARIHPTAVLLDEPVLGDCAPDMLESAVAELTEDAPVVVVAAPERQSDLAFLITSGAVDFVARVGKFLPVAVGLLERRLRLAEQVQAACGITSAQPGSDFGEILRHEVNNPLTGILGNAELLLARRNQLPPAAVLRLQTIADLAVRLRETIRQLSNAWERRHDHARSA